MSWDVKFLDFQDSEDSDEVSYLTISLIEKDQKSRRNSMNVSHQLCSLLTTMNEAEKLKEMT